MTPEQKARVSIDALLVAGGWHACNVYDANIHAATGVELQSTRYAQGLRPLAEPSRIVAEVDRHLSIIREVEVDANLQRAQALRQATLARTFAADR